jgi:hypothetical protein
MLKTLSVAAAAAIGLAVSLSAQTTSEPPDTFKVNYYSHAVPEVGPYVAIPDGTVRITNVGTQIGAPAVGGFPSGSLCAVVLVFAPDQQLAECCGCIVTPDGLLTLSINDDLTNNPLTGATLTTGDIKIVSAGMTCEANNFPPSAGIRAWATHIQNDLAITETPFTDSTLSAGELKLVQNRCAAIFNNGSLFGRCHCPGEGPDVQGGSSGKKVGFSQP